MEVFIYDAPIMLAYSLSLSLPGFYLGEVESKESLSAPLDEKGG